MTTNTDKLLLKELKKRKIKIAAAESCTGGLIGGRITRIPGISEYFEGGIIAYSNRIKISELNVSGKLLKKYGAVSDKTAIAMAEGILKKFKVNLGISVTGIAGPGGGTKLKPVGTVYIAIADSSGFKKVRKWNFTGSRESIRKKTVSKAVNMIKDYLLKNN